MAEVTAATAPRARLHLPGRAVPDRVGVPRLDPTTEGRTTDDRTVNGQMMIDGQTIDDRTIEETRSNGEALAEPRLAVTARRGGPAATPEPVSASSLLFVCTGNVYRSVAAAAMLATRVGAEQRRYAIRSAGIGALEQEWPPRVRRALRRYNIELPEGRSHRLTGDDVEQAFLVLGMDLLHMRSIQSHYPHVLGKTFLLLDFVDRSNRLGGRPLDVSLAEWIDRIDADRRRDEELDDDLEIPDPDRRSTGELRRVLRRINVAVDQLTTLVLTPARPSGRATG